MFDELEKIWIEEIFTEKYNDLMEKQQEYFNNNFKFSEALINDCEAVKSAFEKIKEMF